MGVLPLAGGIVLTWAFVQSVIDLADPENSDSGVSWLGVSVPLAITIVSLVIGLVLMVAWWQRSPAYFRGRPEAFGDDGPKALPGPTASGVASRP